MVLRIVRLLSGKNAERMAHVANASYAALKPECAARSRAAAIFDKLCSAIQLRRDASTVAISPKEASWRKNTPILLSKLNFA